MRGKTNCRFDQPRAGWGQSHNDEFTIIERAAEYALVYPEKTYPRREGFFAVAPGTYIRFQKALLRLLPVFALHVKIFSRIKSLKWKG
jgi:hypothetical protein